MAKANYVKSNGRSTKFARRHRKLAHGYVGIESHNGLIVPTRRQRRKRLFSITPLLLIIAGFLGFKAFLLIYLGPITYADRVAKLADGSRGEQFGAWIMSVDPVTTWVVLQISTLL